MIVLDQSEGLYTNPIPVRGTKIQIEGYAERVAKLIGYLPGANLIDVVTSLKGTITYTDDFEFEEGVFGAIKVNGNCDYNIYLPESGTSTNRDRFTIAHELGHYFLHSNQGKIKIFVKRDTVRSDLLEWQANWFAAAFLMPSGIATELKKKGYSTKYAADFFRVSQQALLVRWESLGL